MKRMLEFLKPFRAPWLLAAGAAACIAAVAVWWGGLNQDEGWYLYAAQMVHDGKLPYRDFFFTQGPTMPFVYAVLSPVWRLAGSPLHGLLGGRVVTLAFGLAAALVAVALVRHLVPERRRGLAGIAVFAMLGCNLYHMYFTTIPKTYALGGLFVVMGFLMLVRGLKSSVPMLGNVLLLAAGLSLAFASGTRISLVLILPVVGIALLFRFKEFRWSFLWFGMGGALGLFLTYGLFAMDPPSLRALLAAQGYHAARGGFDPVFAIGSVSRLLRGYAALCVLGLAVFMKAKTGSDDRRVADGAVARLALWAMAAGFAAVFLLQLSAPFPYDDYQVPIMGLLAVIVGAWFARTCGDGDDGARAAWFAVLVSCGISFVSPLLQEWATYSQDRFWSQKKEETELAKLRRIGREVEFLDPGGKTLLTQDLYLAIEAGRTVPEGLEMGPFSYFPDWPTEKARALHVMNRELMAELLESAPCPLVACSGYAFAIKAPSCEETPFSEQKGFFETLKKNYERADTEPRFGQNATTLLLLKRRGDGK